MCDHVISQQALRKWVFNCTCSLESPEWVNWQTQLLRPSTVVWETRSCTNSRRDCVWPLTNTQHEETLSCSHKWWRKQDKSKCTLNMVLHFKFQTISKWINFLQCAQRQTLTIHTSLIKKSVWYQNYLTIMSLYLIWCPVQN